MKPLKRRSDIDSYDAIGKILDDINLAKLELWLDKSKVGSQ